MDKGGGVVFWMPRNIITRNLTTPLRWKTRPASRVNNSGLFLNRKPIRITFDASRIDPDDLKLHRRNRKDVVKIEEVQRTPIIKTY